MLDRDSKNWSIRHFNFNALIISDENGRVIFNYDTNVLHFHERVNVLSIDYRLVETINSFFPLMDEYYIKMWFEKKYRRTVDEVTIAEMED
jgi:hypothetical protein